MYLNKLKKPNGDIYLSIREKYHVHQERDLEKEQSRALATLANSRRLSKILLPTTKSMQSSLQRKGILRNIRLSRLIDLKNLKSEPMTQGT